jgi:ankyrin repeat protein
MVSVLLEYLPQDIIDIIMLYVDASDVLEFGKDNVSEYIWFRKKDKDFKTACKNNNILAVQYLIESKIDTNIWNAYKEAINFGRLNIVQYCIKQNVDVDYCYGYALKQSAYANNLEIVRYLVDECGSNINKWIVYPIVLDIAEKGSLDVIKYFADEKGINMQGWYNIILKRSIIYGKFNIVEYCVSKGININYDDGNMLKYSAVYGNLDYVQKSLEHNTIVVKRSSIQKTPLSVITNTYRDIFLALDHSVTNGHLHVVKYLVGIFDDIYIVSDNSSYGVSINADTTQYRTYANLKIILYSSIRYGKTAVAKYLIMRGNNIHANIDIALTYCIQYGRTDLMKFLVKQGADLGTDLDKMLQESVNRGHVGFSKYLVSCGAEFDDINELLDQRMSHGSINIILYLIKNGACHDTAVISSIKHGRIGIVDYFIKQGVSLNSMLEIAMEYENHKIVQYLIKRGGKVDNSNTSLKHAIQYGYSDTLKSHFKGNTDIDSILRVGIKLDKYHNIKHLITTTEHKHTALLLSIEFNKLSVVKILINEGIDVNANDNAALICSLNHNLSNMTYFLIRSGDIHSALHLSIGQDRLDLVQYIEKKGVDMNANNNAALGLSIGYKHLDITEWLIRYAIRKNIAITIVQNGVAKKFKTKYKNILECVLVNIDNATIVNSDGQTAMTIAVSP